MKTIRMAGIILAAGTSSRMGRAKQLLPYQGRPILEGVVHTASAGGLDPVVVVLGHLEEKLRQRVDFKNAVICSNPDYSQGQSTSLKAGLNAIPGDCAAAMFLLGDQPLLQARVINRLVRAYAQHRALLVIPTYQGRRGNPVIVDRALFERVRQIQGDFGARVLFTEYAGQTQEVPFDQDAVLADVDTPEDYDRLLHAAPGSDTCDEPC